jgi:hypothetical protein
MNHRDLLGSFEEYALSSISGVALTAHSPAICDAPCTCEVTPDTFARELLWITFCNTVEDYLRDFYPICGGSDLLRAGDSQVHRPSHGSL